LLFLALAVGCSVDSNPTAPIIPENTLPGLSASTGGQAVKTDSHYLWGYWALVFDPVEKTVEAVPLRQTELHVNVVKFLEDKIMYISFADLNFDIPNELIELDVQLTHPFPGLNEYTGFDVRGIFITPGSVSGYSDPGIVRASDDETHLANADGWTRWWNPSEFPVGMSILGYRNGKLGVPYDGSNLNATLNGYKYFSNDLKADDGLDALKPLNRGLFSPGYSNRRHYSIHFDFVQPLIYNYAVDASWELPDPNPPSAIPGDFPPEANMAESYRIVPEIVSNDLFYLNSTNKGGHAQIDVHVYDWFGCDFTEVSLEAPGTYDVNVTSPSGGTVLYSTYQVDLYGIDLNSSNDLTALITATSNDAVYGLGDLSSDNVATYLMMEIPVQSTAEPPTVISIDPIEEYIGELLNDVVVTGTNFAPNAEVELIKSSDPSVIIEADNEVVSGDTNITCDLDLGGPTVEVGKYNVRVTNPDTSLYGELLNGFTVNDLAHPWPRWRGNDLSNASSQYVGYGDSSASTSPKWIFPQDWNSSYTCSGGATAGCAVANDGTIYLNTYNSAMYAVNPDGSFKWMFKPQTPWISVCPAIDKDGYVYTCMGNPSYSYLYKVDPSTGTAVWTCNLSDVPCYTTAPVIGLDGAVYVIYSTAYDAGYIQRVEPGGTLGWSYWIPSSAYSYTWQLGASVLPNGDIIATGGTHGRILCFAPDGGGVPKWTYQHTSWILHTPAVGPEGNIYFTTWMGGELVAIDSDGNYLWTYETDFYLWASPAVDPDTGNIFLGDRKGIMRCFEPDGDIVWTRTFASTGIDGSAAVDANGDVYVAIGNQPGNPYRGLIKLDGETGDTIWQADDIGDMITTCPAIGADGTIYLPGISNTKALYAYGE
jgi:outer membrane protein assembly factor BamB